MNFMVSSLYLSFLIPCLYLQEAGRERMGSSSAPGRLKSKLNAIDFFGNSGIPCVGIPPHSNKLQSEFESKLTIISVSHVKEKCPTKLINARSTSAIALYTTGIANRLSRKNKLMEVHSVIETEPVVIDTNRSPANPLVELSQEFIYAVKTGDDADSLMTALKITPYENLKQALSSDDEKKAFWIHIYNGYAQIILKRSPEKYESRNKFFKSKQVEVAGKTFSLDDIEHGILRRSKIKWSLGHLNKCFPGKTEKELRVDYVDYRIHFTLNCGAKSCPPIAFYDAENLDRQLDLATRAYLTAEATYDDEKNTAWLPAIMGWFRKDFGGKKKMEELLKQINVIPPDGNPKIKFKKYDWNLFLDHYKLINQL